MHRYATTYLLLLVAFSSVIPQSPFSALSTVYAQETIIAGTVTDEETGKPVSRIRVYLLAVGGKDGPLTLSRITSADGRFSMNVGDAKEARLVFQESEYIYVNETVPEYNGGDIYFELEPGKTNIVDVQLEKTALIQGVVTDAKSDAPIPNILVEVVARGTYYATTDAQGRYSVRVAVPSSPFIKLWFRDPTTTYDYSWYERAFNEADATPVEVTRGQTTTADMQLEKPGTINVKVQTDEKAESQGTLIFSYTTCDYYNLDRSCEVNLRSRPGQFKVGYVWYSSDRDYTNGYYNLKPTRSQADPIEVTSEMTTTVTFDLTSLSEIRGQVRVQDRPSPVSPVAPNFIVQAFNEDGEQVAQAYTRQDGTYRIMHLVPGSYTISFTGAVEPPCTKLCDDPQQLYVPYEYPQAISIRRGQTVDLDVSVTEIGAPFYDALVYLPLVSR